MIARLNLASDPFRNRTLPWTVAAVVSLVSLVALVYTFSQYREASAEAAATDRQVRALRDERAGLEKQAQEVRQNIPEEQLKVHGAAQSLVSRKSFSWSQLFADLEASLPSSVRVMRINVREVAQVGDQTRADLDLTVMARSPTDVTGMIIDMSRGSTFNAVPVSESHKSGRGESGYEWLLRVSYVQRARRTSEPAAGGEVGENTDAREGAQARTRGNESGGRD